MTETMALVYDWVKETRKGLLEYAATLPPAVFTQERHDFGWGSIRNLLVHVADCYRFWLAETAMNDPRPAFEPSAYPGAKAVAELFGETDRLASVFLARWPGARMGETLSLRVKWAKDPLVVSPLWLLTHTITHEFHHKGQAVALGRVLGCPPPETDLSLPARNG